MTYFSCGQVLFELQQFISKINEIYNSIKFDFNYSKTQIQFLDKPITKASNGKLLTTLYKKVIDWKFYLHLKSEHPYSMKHSLFTSTEIKNNMYYRERFHRAI